MYADADAAVWRRVRSILNIYINFDLLRVENFFYYSVQHKRRLINLEHLLDYFIFLYSSRELHLDTFSIIDVSKYYIKNFLKTSFTLVIELSFIRIIL